MNLTASILILAVSTVVKTIVGPKCPEVPVFLNTGSGVEAVVAQYDDKSVKMPTNIALLRPCSGIVSNRNFATEYIVTDGSRRVLYGRATRIDTGDDNVMKFSELDASRVGHSVRGIKYEPGFPWCFHGTKIICVDGEFTTEEEKRK